MKLFCLIAYILVRIILHKTAAEEQQLSGKVCYNQQLQSYTMMKTRLSQTTYYYTSKCHFWNWGRCTITGKKYHATYYTDFLHRYVKNVQCCPGWKQDSSQRCSIHTKEPIASCPSPQTLRRRTSVDNVTWFEPFFREAFSKSLIIKKPYPHNSATSTSTSNTSSTAVLNWGRNDLKYTATSENNGLSSSCTVTILVEPYPPKPTIVGYINNETALMNVEEERNITCVVPYSKKPVHLVWRINGSVIITPVTNREYESDYPGHWNSESTLLYKPTISNDGATLTCTINGSSDIFQLSINVSYEVAPVVTYCPESQIEISTRLKAFTSWRKAQFKDPRWDEEVQVTSSLGSDTTSKEFSWGMYTIVYTGTNVRNRLTATCKFSIVVQPPRCNKDEILPVHGALVCGTWDEYYLQACFPVCAPQGRHSKYLYHGSYSAISTCGVNGLWSPNIGRLNCTQAVANEKMEPEEDSFVGTCVDHSVTNSLKTNFINKMVVSDFNLMCGKVHRGANVTLEVICPSNG